jgi:hypothetical protein
MVKIGLWLELVVGVGFVVGLGFGALTGQRTVATIVLIALQVIVTRSSTEPTSPISSMGNASSWESPATSYNPRALPRVLVEAAAGVRCNTSGPAVEQSAA